MGGTGLALITARVPEDIATMLSPINATRGRAARASMLGTDRTNVQWEAASELIFCE
jgi:hypothetical protein